jgi:hypothetical protein
MSDYNLSFSFSPLSNLIITHLSTGDIFSEGEFNIWQDSTKDHNVSIYKKCTVNTEGLITSTWQLLYNFRNNYLINFGVRDLELYSAKSKHLSPGVLSLGAITKINEQANMTTWGGMHMNVKPKNLDNVSLVLGLSTPSLNGVLQLLVERKDNYGLPTTTTTTTIGTSAVGTSIIVDTNTTEPYYYQQSAKVGVEAKIADNFYIYTTMTAKNEKTISTELVTGGLYTLDPTTNLKFKVTDALQATVSLTKRFRDLFDFTFTSNFNFNKPVASDYTLGNIKTKFGLTFTLLDETLI